MKMTVAMLHSHKCEFPIRNRSALSITSGICYYYRALPQHNIASEHLPSAEPQSLQ